MAAVAAGISDLACSLQTAQETLFCFSEGCDAMNSKKKLVLGYP